MTHPRDAEVIIVGGGPAGSTAAFYLARAGCDVLLLDRAHFPRDKPCSEYLSPQAGRILHEMDALDALERGPSARLAGMRVRAPNGTVFRGDFAAVTGFKAFRDYGLSVRRPILDAMLLSRARAAGARVREGVDVRDAVRDGEGRVTGVLARSDGSESPLRAALVIGADGLRSVIARRTGLGSHGHWPRRVAFVAHARGARIDGDVGEMYVFQDGYIGLAPVGGGVTNVALVVPTTRAAEARGDATGFLRRTLASHRVVADRLEAAEWEESVRAVGPFNWRARVAWAPGVVLVGDAAEFFDPFTGEGMYTAMRGAELLATYAWEAARAQDSRSADVALAAYDRCRRAEFRGKWTVERAIAMAVSSPSLMNRAAAGLAGRPDLANLLVGVTGDFVPASEVLDPRYILRLLNAAFHSRFQAGDPAPGVSKVDSVLSGSP